MIKSCSDIIEHVRKGKKKTISVAAAHDDAVIKAVIEAKRLGICDAVLCGYETEIRRLIEAEGADAADYTIIDAQDNLQAAALAVEELKNGHADFIMKGIIGTADVMRAVLNKEAGMRTGRLLSHCCFYEIPGLGRLICDTDGGLNTYPDLAQKADIIENAAILLKAMGYGRIYASCICGAETVNPKIQATVDAAELSKMTDRWEKYDMIVEGPVAFDLAMSEEACRHKGYKGVGGGKADILLVPSYEVGNVMGKTLSLFGNAKSAGVIVGARVPVVLVSRSDGAETKLNSIALGALAAEAQF